MRSASEEPLLEEEKGKRKSVSDNFDFRVSSGSKMVEEAEEIRSFSEGGYHLLPETSSDQNDHLYENVEDLYGNLKTKVGNDKAEPLEHAVGTSGIKYRDSKPSDEEELTWIPDDGEDEDCYCMSTIAEYHYVRENAFPVVKEKPVWSEWSVDSSSTEGSVKDVHVFVEGANDTSAVSNKIPDDKSPGNYNKFRGARSNVKFLGSLSSESSGDGVEEANDITDASKDKNENLQNLIVETFENKALGRKNSTASGNSKNDAYHRSYSVEKKHTNVLHELKSKVKASRNESKEEKVQKKRFGDVLLELKSHSLVSVICKWFLFSP